jgi:hypothetical protein
MLGFKRFFNARRVVAGVELVQKDRKRSVRCSRKLRHGPVLYMLQHAGGVNLAPICNRSLLKAQKGEKILMRLVYDLTANDSGKEPGCRRTGFQGTRQRAEKTGEVV